MEFEQSVHLTNPLPHVVWFIHSKSEKMAECTYQPKNTPSKYILNNSPEIFQPTCTISALLGKLLDYFNSSLYWAGHEWYYLFKGRKWAEKMWYEEVHLYAQFNQ